MRPWDWLCPNRELRYSWSTCAKFVFLCVAKLYRVVLWSNRRFEADMWYEPLIGLDFVPADIWPVRGPVHSSWGTWLDDLCHLQRCARSTPLHVYSSLESLWLDLTINQEKHHCCQAFHGWAWERRSKVWTQTHRGIFKILGQDVFGVKI